MQVKSDDASAVIFYVANRRKYIIIIMGYVDMARVARGKQKTLFMTVGDVYGCTHTAHIITTSNIIRIPLLLPQNSS